MDPEDLLVEAPLALGLGVDRELVDPRVVDDKVVLLGTVILIALICGSPPRVWGQCIVRGAITRLHRFTPTRVGTIGSIRSC